MTNTARSHRVFGLCRGGLGCNRLDVTGHDVLKSHAFGLCTSGTKPAAHESDAPLRNNCARQKSSRNGHVAVGLCAENMRRPLGSARAAADFARRTSDDPPDAGGARYRDDRRPAAPHDQGARLRRRKSAAGQPSSRRPEPQHAARAARALEARIGSSASIRLCLRGASGTSARAPRARLKHRPSTAEPAARTSRRAGSAAALVGVLSCSPLERCLLMSRRAGRRSARIRQTRRNDHGKRCCSEEGHW
jgi:hypothetical protein